MKRILILSNGAYGDYSWCKALDVYDMVICADNGILHAKQLGLKVDYLLGDLDSAPEQVVAAYEAAGTIVEKMPAEKDETDTELALEKAFALGATAIDIFGGVGSRMDHSLCNMQLLYRSLQRNVSVRLMDAHNCIQLVDHAITLSGKVGDLVSLVPFSAEVVGVTTTGLAYSVTDGSFAWGQVYGVSNYLTEEHATITIKKGLLLVIEARD